MGGSPPCKFMEGWKINHGGTHSILYAGRIGRPSSVLYVGWMGDHLVPCTLAGWENHQVSCMLGVYSLQLVLLRVGGLVPKDYTIGETGLQ